MSPCWMSISTTNKWLGAGRVIGLAPKGCGPTVKGERNAPSPQGRPEYH